MYFLISKNDDFSFLWFREDKTEFITNLFTYFCKIPQIDVFTEESLTGLSSAHKFIIFIENPFEKVLYDAIHSKSYNFETFIMSLSKKIDSQLSSNFKNLDLEQMFFLNIHNIDMNELEKILNQKSLETNDKNVIKPKQFQNYNAKLFRQPFKDIILFDYDFNLEQFYNLELQSIVSNVYKQDFEYFKQHDIYFENPIIELKPIKSSKSIDIEKILEDKKPYFKAKSELQRINNKIGYCHLYDDHYMFIDEKGQANISRNLVHFSVLTKDNNFVKKNFNHIVHDKKK